MRDKLWVWRTSSKTKISVLLKLDSLSTIRNKMIAQGEKLETSAKLRVILLNLSLPRQYTRYGFLFLVFLLL